MPSILEKRFENLWESLFPQIDLEAEVCLIPNRRFRFDYVNHEAKVAIEINGQIWQKGGHSSGTGIMRDYEKLNLAQKEGYIVFQLCCKMITKDWLSAIAQTIENRSENQAS